MSITRIKRNQITDLEVIASKLAENAVTASKLDLDLIYPSNLTITGNLTVQGATTVIDTTNTVVADPLIVLARSQSGSASLDAGIIIERGTDTNVAFAWDESNDRFMATFTTETGTTAGTINKSGYADLIVGNLTASNFSANIGNVASGQVVYGTTGGALKSEADFAYNETTNTLTVAGNVTVGNVRVGIDSINTSGTNIDLTVSTNGGNVATASRINVTNAAASSSTTTGALVVAGGVGIGEKLYVSANLVVGGTDVINAINTVSNAVSVVSAQVATNSAQMVSADNAISNAVSVVSAAQLSTQNALSNEISARQAASADLQSAINVVSNAVSAISNAISAVSAQVATNSAQMVSADNAISNAVSIVSAAQLSTQNALSNEISARQEASANLQSAINVVSNAVSVVSAQVATNSAQMTSADNAISNAVSVVSVAQLSTWNAVSNEISVRAAASAALESHINTVSNSVSVVSAAIASVETHVNTVSNAVSVVSAQVATNSAQMVSADNAISNAVSVVSAAQLSTWNKVSAILTSSQTFSGATYSFTGNTNSTNTSTGTIVVGGTVGGVGIAGNLNVGGISQFSSNVNILGNLYVQGNYTIIGSNNTSYTDNIIELHTQATLSALTVDDGKDIGIHIHYFKGSDSHAFLGWDNSSGYLEWQDSGAEGSDTFTGNYGTMRLGNLIANASTAATSTTSGAITTNGGIGVVGNAYIGGNLVVGSTNIVDALSALSNYASVASAAIVSVESHVNTVSNAVSVVSAAQLSTQNALSNEISARQTASADLQSAINVVSNAISVVSAQVATNSAQMVSADNAISNAVSVVSAAQLSTQNALSNEISARQAASADLQSAINVVSNAISVVSAQVATNSAQMSSADAALSVRIDTISNLVSVTSADLASAKSNLQSAINVVSNAVSAVSAAVNAVSVAAQSAINTVSNAVSVVSAAAASIESHVNTVSNAVSVVSAQVATNSAQMTSADNAISNAVSVVSAAQLSTWNKVSAILTSSTTFSGATYTFSGSTASTNTITGAVVITGGLGVGGNINAANISIVGNTIATTNSNGNLVLQPNGTGATVVNDSGAASNFVVKGDTDAALIFVDATNDNIGIGTATPNTAAKLHINSTNSIIIPKGTTGERPGVGVVTAGMVRFNTSSTDLEFYTGTAWQGTGSTFTVIADDKFTGDGSTVIFSLSSAQTTNSCIVSINGIVQIPTDAYGVSGSTLTFTEAPAAGDIIDVREITTTTTIASLASDNGFNVIELTNAGGVLFSSGTSSAVERWRINTAGSFVPSANISYNIGNATNYVNTVYANVFNGTATQAQYADLAEKYLADTKYEPGTVMVFGGVAEITQANIDSDRRVAGVVSDKPAYLMNSELAGQYVTDLALLGRVPCKVIGPIQKGDMLVVAGNGHARSEANPVTGSVIGKALENFDGTTGTIEIVVGRM